MQVDIDNFPPNSEELELRTFLLGSTNPLLIAEMSETEDGKNHLLITISGGAENTEVLEFISEVSQLLATVADSPKAALAAMEALDDLADGEDS